MVKAFILTIPRTVPKKALKVMIEKNDCKKWIIGFEVGNDGYRHYQARLVSSNHDFFEWVKAHIPTAHVEEASTDKFDYERKSGNFISSDDTPEIRQIRFGNLRENQKKIINIVRKQNDRQIDVFYDHSGNHGKTWLSIYLYEKGRGLVVPRASTTAEKLSAYICSAYKGEEYIIIDIPRARKVTGELYEAIEELKDGLVFDHRYSGYCRNVRGVKIIIFTNSKLDTKQLSKDRWRLHSVTPKKQKKQKNPSKGGETPPSKPPQ